MPCLIKSNLIVKSLRKTAHSKGVPMVVFEGGESLRIDENVIEEGLRGLRNVLIHSKMIKGKLDVCKTHELENISWLRANRSGIFTLEKKSGEYVQKGAVLGRITNPYNTYQSKVIAKSDGFIFRHNNNNPVVNKGDALFHIGN